MKCVICKQGQTNKGTATVTLDKGHTTVVIRDVPAEICDNCGEYYLDEQVAEKIQQKAELAVQQGIEVEVLSYAA
jgi:YgiT-type zinc finger domain-containing protein